MVEPDNSSDTSDGAARMSRKRSLIDGSSSGEKMVSGK
jgi:hypothetical protein